MKEISQETKNRVRGIWERVKAEAEAKEAKEALPVPPSTPEPTFQKPKSRPKPQKPKKQITLGEILEIARQNKWTLDTPVKVHIEEQDVTYPIHSIGDNQSGEGILIFCEEPEEAEDAEDE